MVDETTLETIRQRFAGRLPARTDMRAVVKEALTAFSTQTLSARTDAAAPPLSFQTEAIVRRYIRPPMLIKDDKIVYNPVPHFPELTEEAVRSVEHMVTSVGRVEFLNHAMRWGGTGFVVERLSATRSLFVTNRHVAEIVARRARDGSGVFLRSNFGVFYGMKLDFKEEVDAASDARFELKAERIRYLADLSEPDVALIEIQTRPDLSPEPLLLADWPAKDRELVATIGYPAYDDRNDLTQMREYFGDLFDVKRFAGGLVMQEPGSLILRHDCTTLGGNSGSSLISLDDKRASKNRVVGLHFQGEFGVENAAVGVETLKRLLRDGRGPIVPGALLAGADERPDGSHEASVFAGREGYQPAFLGENLIVPLPSFGPEIADDLARPTDALPDRPFELRYTHFGVYYSVGRRAPRVAAVNIDGARAVRVKRGDDQWFFDLRIPRDIQHGQKAYADPKIDRGHMVRREDPNWAEPDGKDIATALLANDDTFHYTNSALQHSSLNQGKTLWQGLENYILDSARTQGFKACVFTGPVLRDDDPLIQPGGPQIPVEFWKIVAMPAAEGGLHATGYLLSQGDLIRDLLATRGRSEAAEGFVLGAYRTFQVAISHIEAITGLRFDVLRGADPLADRIGLHETAAGGGVGYYPLDTLEAVVLDGRAVGRAGSVADDEAALLALGNRIAAAAAASVERDAEAPAVLGPLVDLAERKAVEPDVLARIFQEYHEIIAGARRLSEAAVPSFESLKPEYDRLYAHCEIRPEKKGEVAWHVGKLRAFEPRYRKVGDRLGIPWWFVGVTHALEASFNFNGHLHNGDPLSARTVQVPRGRPLAWNPPSDWEWSAVDALSMKGYAGQSDWSLARALYRFERYNGWGYRSASINIPTPYLWSFSNHYKKGKFVRDGVYDANAVSKQCGAAVMLKALEIGSEDV